MSSPGEEPSRTSEGGLSEGEFRAFFSRSYPALLRFFRRMGFSAEDSRDLAQEAFIRASRGISYFRGQASIHTWLLSIASSVGINEIRSRSAIKRRSSETSLDESSEAMAVPAKDPHPLENALARERAGLVREALDELPGQMRRCILLRIDQHLTYGEIADVLGISVSTVKAHLHQARVRLRQRLAGQFPELQ